MENLAQDNICVNNFNITWDIKNLFLSFYSQENENPVIKSSELCAQNLKNTKWSLEFYPAGMAVGENPSVVLRMLDSDVKEVNIGVNFEISPVTDTATSVIQCTILHPGEGVQCEMSYKVSELKRISRECADDTIRIKCFMRDYSCNEYRTINAVTCTTFNYNACSFPCQIALEESYTCEVMPRFDNYQSALLKINMMISALDEENNILRILVVPVRFATCFSYQISTVDDEGNKLHIGRELYTKEKGSTMHEFPVIFNRSTSSDSNQRIMLCLKFYIKTGVSNYCRYEEI